MSYSFDTSALLDAWVRYYPPDVFGTLWKRLDGLITEGRLIAVDEVRRELARMEDGLHAWVNERAIMMVPLDEPLQLAGAAIINRFPSLTSTKGAMGGSADPYVIALAQIRKLTVVTAEKPKPTKPRIPDVCQAMGVPHINLVELFRREAWTV